MLLHFFLQGKVQIPELSLGFVVWRSKIRKVKVGGFCFACNVLPVQLSVYTAQATGPQAQLFNTVDKKESNFTLPTGLPVAS